MKALCAICHWPVKGLWRQKQITMKRITPTQMACILTILFLGWFVWHRNRQTPSKVIVKGCPKEVVDAVYEYIVSNLNDEWRLPIFTVDAKGCELERTVFFTVYWKPIINHSEIKQ